MTASYTFDVFTSLDGYASHTGHWGAYWGKQGPQLVADLLARYSQPQRMVFGARTFREFAEFRASMPEMFEAQDSWAAPMSRLPMTVVSSTLTDTLGWPDARVENTDAVDVVTRLKEESDVPLRSHGSLSLNRALLTAGLVDRIQLTVFPVITGKTGTEPIFEGLGDFDLELLATRTLDGNIQELVYRPTCH